MNSPIKLPPLPELPPEIIVDEGYDGEIYMGQDEDALRAWATAYAEQAVREALAAQQPLFLYDHVSGAMTPIGKPVGEWLPIETAPKDGSHFIALGPIPRHGSIEVRETYWSFFGEGSIAKALFESGKGPSGNWAWEEPLSNWISSWNPTHWQPLPAPPKENNHGDTP